MSNDTGLSMLQMSLKRRMIQIRNSRIMTDVDLSSLDANQIKAFNHLIDVLKEEVSSAQSQARRFR